VSAQGLYKKLKFNKPMLDPRKDLIPDLIPCSYRNNANTVQIVRISEPMFAYFERVVMPGQILYFKATEDSMLEVYEANMASSAHVDTFPCQQLSSIGSIGTNNNNLLKKEISPRNHSLVNQAA
jgi:hypothetical protein